MPEVVLMQREHRMGVSGVGGGGLVGWEGGWGPPEMSPKGSQEGQTQAGSCRGPGSNPASVMLCDLE